MMKKQPIALLLGICLSTALYAQDSVKIEAESYTEKSDKITVSKRKEGGTAIGNFSQGQWIKLENIDFGKGKNNVKIRAASGTTTKRAGVEIRLGSKDGKVIGNFKIPVKGWNVFTEENYALSRKVSKKRDIYIVSLSGSMILDWVEFTK